MDDKKRPPSHNLSFSHIDKKHIMLKKEPKEELRMYDHFTTPLIRPNSNFDLREHQIFARRSFRLISGLRLIKIPEVSDEESEGDLNGLMREYSNQAIFQNEDLNHQSESKIPQHNLKLLKARDYLLDENLSVKQISDLVGLKMTQVSSLQKRLLTTGEVLPFKKKRSTKLNQEHLEFLIHLLDQKNGCLNTLPQLKIKLLEQFPLLVDISEMTIDNTLRRAGYSFKKISPYIDRRNYVLNVYAQKRVSKQLLSILANSYKIIFVDETGIKLNSCPKYGWGKKGEKLSLEIKADKQNYSIMAAITDSEVLGCQIIKDGGTTKANFLGFLCTLVHECIDKNETDAVFIFLDNASWHTTPYIKEALGTELNFIFNAAYSPMLNPIEEFFSKFKKIVKKEMVKNDIELFRAIQNALRAFTPNDFKGYIRHVLRYISSSLRNEILF